MEKVIVCLNCGKDFIIRRKRRVDNAKFCSLKCKHEYSRILLECKQCGKEFKRTKGIIRSRKNKNDFCSIECKFDYDKIHGSWNKGLNYLEVTCDWCGKKIIKPQSILNQYINHFCSNDCYDQWKSKNRCGSNNNNWKSDEIECGYCGKKYYISPSVKNKGKRHFCSRKCFGNWNSENLFGENHHSWNSKEIACDECGIFFLRPPSQISNHSFCSKKCLYIWQGHQFLGENNPNWCGGGVRYRGSNWHEQRQKALDRDDYTCQKCGSLTRLAVHHKIPFRLFGLERYIEANNLDNLLTVCKKCHARLETEYNREQKKIECMVENNG